MCKEVDNDSNNSDNSVKVKKRDSKVLPITEKPATIPENNQFSPPKHKTSYINNGVKIDDNEIDDISFSSLETSNNHASQNQKNISNNSEKSSSTVYENDESSKDAFVKKNGGDNQSQNKNSSDDDYNSNAETEDSYNSASNSDSSYSKS